MHYLIGAAAMMLMAIYCPSLHGLIKAWTHDKPLALVKGLVSKILG